MHIRHKVYENICIWGKVYQLRLRVFSGFGAQRRADKKL